LCSGGIRVVLGAPSDYRDTLGHCVGGGTQDLPFLDVPLGMGGWRLLTVFVMTIVSMGRFLKARS
jgi:hypothetical protein